MIRFRSALLLAPLALGFAACDAKAPTGPPAAAGPTGATAAADPGAATTRYWAAARVAATDAQVTRARLEREAGSPAAAAAALERYARAGEDLADQLAGLPVLAADPEAVGFVRDYATQLREEAAVIREISALVRDARAFGQQAGSVGAMFEAFARGALGDPLGKASEIAGGQGALEARRVELLARARPVDARGIRLAAAQQDLRAALARRYGREFPPLTPPPAAADRAFGPAEVARARARLERDVQAVGRLLVGGTHPTGAFASARLAGCEATPDGRELRVAVRCSWRGFSGSAYETEYRFVVEKGRGVTDLRVASDTAVFGADEAHRAETQGRLHEYWEAAR